MSAVLASGGVAGGGVSSSVPLNGGANTVAGSGTERSSPASALVSVPAHGVAPAGTPDAEGAPDGTPACVSGRAPAEAPEPEPAPAPDRPAPDPPRRSGIPSWSAASCNHSGGVNKKDV